MQKTELNSSSHVTFDLHGIVGICVENASPKDLAVVERQLGPILGPLQRDPDIVIKFVDRLHLSSRLRYLGLNDAGYTDDAYFVLRSKHKARTRVQIPFTQIGQQCEIICERGIPAVPLLLPIVNLSALERGFLPLHASAFIYRGIGTLVTGWAKGGKTETLLGFISEGGASYVGDEWIYLSKDGNHMYGIPEPIRVWDAHLQYLPKLRIQLRWREKTRLWALRRAVKTLDWIAHRERIPAASTARRIGSLLQRQQNLQIPPHRMFGHDSCPLAGTLTRIIFAVSHNSPDIVVKPDDPDRIARRMVFSLQEEYSALFSHYSKFRFAFPDLKNEFIEHCIEGQGDSLKSIFQGKETYSVSHPYPVPIPALFSSLTSLYHNSTDRS